MTFKKTAARVAVVAALALTASSVMAGKDRDKDDDDKGGHGCGRHHSCTVPEPGTLALTTLAAFAAVGIPAIRRRRATKSQT